MTVLAFIVTLIIGTSVSVLLFQAAGFFCDLSFGSERWYARTFYLTAYALLGLAGFVVGMFGIAFSVYILAVGV